MTDLRVSPALDETRFPGMALTLRVARLATLWRTRLDRALRPHDMTLALMRPLAYLTMLPEGATQSELAAAMNVDCSALVRVLDLLQKQGFVSRQPDRQDRRAKRLMLTPAGHARCALFHRIAAELERESCESLSPGTIGHLIEGLTTLLVSHNAQSQYDQSQSDQSQNDQIQHDQVQNGTPPAL
ncbi:MAG: MarR family transcriptional regulator, partial [Acetobacter sp.]